MELDCSNQQNQNTPREHPQRKVREETASKNRVRRPDIQRYIPPSRRGEPELQKTTDTPAIPPEVEPEETTPLRNKSFPVLRLEDELEMSSDKKKEGTECGNVKESNGNEPKKSEHREINQSGLDESKRLILSNLSSTPGERPLRRKVAPSQLKTKPKSFSSNYYEDLKEIRNVYGDGDVSDVKVSEVPQASIAEPKKVVPKKSEEDESWDSMFDDDGDSLDGGIVSELTQQVGKVSVHQAKSIDYLNWTPKDTDFDDEEYGHILEIYEFPSDFKSHDIIVALSSTSKDVFDVKWVDDTHCLGVFSSPFCAKEALSRTIPMLKTRPLSQGIKESKIKANKYKEFVQPYKPRPVTSASLARRMVSGALGVRVNIPKEKMELEKKLLQEAKEKKKMIAKQRDDAWNGKLGSE